MGAAAKQMPLKGTQLAHEQPDQLGVTLKVAEWRALIREEVALALDSHQVAEWVDQDAIAQHLGVSAQTVIKMCKEDGLPHSWAGQHRRFSKRLVDEWMATRPPPAGQK